MIKEKIALGWQFNFMGASIDAYAQAQRMGVAVSNTMSYDSTQRATTAMAFASAARNTRSYAAGQSVDTSFLASQKSASGDIYDPALKKPTASAVPPVKTKSVDDFDLKAQN